MESWARQYPTEIGDGSFVFDSKTFVEIERFGRLARPRWRISAVPRQAEHALDGTFFRHGTTSEPRCLTFD